MVDEGTPEKNKKNRTSSVLTREGTYEATSESTVVRSLTNLFLSSSSTSTNELSNKTSDQNRQRHHDRDQPNLFDNIISNYQYESNNNTNLDDEKFEKIETPNDADTTNNSFDFLMNSSSKNFNISNNDEHVHCLNAIIDNLILPLESLNSTQSNVDTQSDLSSIGMFFV